MVKITSRKDFEAVSLRDLKSLMLLKVSDKCPWQWLWDWKAQDVEHGINPLVHILGMGGCTSDACRGCFFQCWGSKHCCTGQWSRGIESTSEEGMQRDMTKEG